jgi:hypothetical protein
MLFRIFFLYLAALSPAGLNLYPYIRLDLLSWCESVDLSLEYKQSARVARLHRLFFLCWLNTVD